MAFHPEDRVVASCSEDKSIKLWNLDDGGLLSTMSGHLRLVTAVSWSPDGTKLASGSYDKTVRIWDSASGEQLCSLNVGYVLKSHLFTHRTFSQITLKIINTHAVDPQ